MLESINPVTQISYSIPDEIDDRANINNFLSEHSGKKVVCVQGLGFVGAVMSLICANALGDEYAVIGVDLPTEESYWKVISFNQGIFPLIADDPKIAKFFDIAKKKKNFFATCDQRAYGYADVVIVDVNLDVQKNSSEQQALLDFDVNLGGFEGALTSLGRYCRQNVLIIVETTVPPGTCEKTVKPIVDREFAKRGLPLEQYSLGHSYERVMPGPNYIDSIREYPRVYSGLTSDCADRVETFLKTIIDTEKCSLTRLSSTNATEIAKVLENSYRAMNIAFIVEWSRFAEEADVDLYEIVHAIRQRETHSNLMFPGLGVGGYCLTKDPLLASWSRKQNFDGAQGLSVSELSVSINDQMPGFAFNRLIEIAGQVVGKKILVLGVSYRGEVGDTRFSPVEPLVATLERAGAEIFLHDPFVSYWPERNRAVNTSLQTFIKHEFDIVIVATKHSLYSSDRLTEFLRFKTSLTIFDTVGALTGQQLTELGTQHKVSVLGDGKIYGQTEEDKN